MWYLATLAGLPDVPCKFIHKSACLPMLLWYDMVWYGGDAGSCSSIWFDLFKIPVVSPGQHDIKMRLLFELIVLLHLLKKRYSEKCLFFAQIKVSGVGLYGLQFYWFQLTNEKNAPGLLWLFLGPTFCDYTSLWLLIIIFIIIAIL